jgi:hypothetical protein
VKLFVASYKFLDDRDALQAERYIELILISNLSAFVS